MMTIIIFQTSFDRLAALLAADQKVGLKINYIYHRFHHGMA